MTTKDFRRKRPLAIFLSYFKNHKKLFLVDVLCACLIAGVDLTFPLITRSALYDEESPVHLAGEHIVKSAAGDQREC